MKMLPIASLTLIAVLTVGSTRLAADSMSVPGHLSNAASHAASASVEAVAASGQVSTAVGKTAVGAVALASGAAGGVITASGAAVAAVGELAGKGGGSLSNSGEKLWDFASSAPADRPTANRERSLPAPKNTVRVDPPPAAMLKTAQR